MLGLLVQRLVAEQRDSCGIMSASVPPSGSPLLGEAE